MPILAIALATWTAFVQPEYGFVVDVPSAPRAGEKPGTFLFPLGDAMFSVIVLDLSQPLQNAVARGDHALVSKALENGRNAMVAELKGTPGTFSAADFEGMPSMAYSFTGTAELGPFISRTRIVFAGDKMVIVGALGPKDQLQPSDIEHFHSSLHLSRAISFSDAVCGRIPPVPISFDMPADFTSFKVPYSAEAGCLWGAKDDIAHVTKDSDSGDFTALRRGVFRTRISTNVVFGNGAFDRMDGSGEAGIRKELESAGVTLKTWRRETVAGLPALQIVGEAAGSRVYMLYLGETKYITNTVLINYYEPANTARENDLAVWERFVAGIKPVK